MSEINRTEVADLKDAHRILIVEDRPELRALLAEQLTELGYRCDCAASCEEGRKAVGEQRYACCLVDLGLPDGSGLELFAAFTQIDPHLVAVRLAGDASA
ncbi:MAG: response regulator, partial [Candidatus Hydrogenedentes bacterium]|nr:response regulator [Candidatus Hydrogenedentota bacterium]